ncbi:MAG: UPF0280 family protein [Bacillota bacterium]
MINQPIYRVLTNGKILVDYGPITMTIEASLRSVPFTAASIAGAESAVGLLKELSSCLEIARRPVAELNPAEDIHYPKILRQMLSSVRLMGEPDFTPMAAVAGSIADLVKETAVDAGADRVVVNNGGDISIHLSPGSTPLRIGIISDLQEGKVTHTLTLFPEQGIGGIATSGLGGRSLTKGVASAVAVLSKNSGIADAAATSIANATNCEDPSVERCLAQEMDHLTDIRGHLVTLRVGRLNADSMESALSKGLKRAGQLFRQKLVEGAVVFVQGQVRTMPLFLASHLKKIV